MPFAKGRQGPKKSKPPTDAAVPEAAPAPPAVARVSALADISPENEAALRARIADLEQRLAAESSARGAAEQAALDAAQAQGALLQTEIQEVPTGKMVEVTRIKKDAAGRGIYKVVGFKDDGRDILRPQWHKVKLPTFFYKIDLPPSGGTEIKLNGEPFYHGTVYEFDVETLSSIKDIVYRGWDHERNISGSNENFYRPKQQPRLGPRGLMQ